MEQLLVGQAHAAWRPKYEKYSHGALIDMILANPTATNVQLGLAFNRSGTWVGMVRSSDLFRENLALRHKEISDPVLTASMDERLSMLTNRSLEVLMEKMARPADLIDDSLAIAAANFGAKAKGLGGFGARIVQEPPAPSIDRIERLAERLVALNGGKRGPIPEVIDIEARPVNNNPES